MTSPAPLAFPPTGLPVEAARAAIEAGLGTGAVVIRAEPGAGKSSLVPLFVADALAVGGGPTTVIVTEPRRLAARATAARLAELLGQAVGRTVGVTLRGEHTVSTATRIEVMTEAVLTNRLQRDPELAGVGAIMFDEFHERNLHSDLALAMSLEARSTLRPDLALVVMSATLDTGPVADLLGAATVVDVAGRTFPVTTHHLPRPERRRLAPALAEVVVRALDAVRGDVLVFVPGRREIDDVLAALGRATRSSTGGKTGGVECLGLHGSTPVAAQRSIVVGGGRRRRVIVATAVAETSITVPGVEAVVDGGLLRRARFDPATGLGRLQTGHATRFAADQRRGRAGRLGPGVCYRLWTEEEHRHLDDSSPPEIVDGDPLPVAFELARWGDPWGESLPLLDHPGAARLQAAQRLLLALGLIDTEGRLSGAGRQGAGLGLHPRLAALVLAASARGCAGLGLRAAALLDDDAWPQQPDLAVELGARWSLLNAPTRRLARQLARRSDGPARGAGATTAASAATASRVARPPGATAALPGEAQHDQLDDLGSLLVAAWPDRVAMARPGRPGRFLLATGREVMVDSDGLVDAPFLVVAEADGDIRAARVRRAVGVNRATVLAASAGRVAWVDQVEWDHRDDTLRAERQQRLGGLVLHRQPLARPAPAAVAEALAAGLRSAGLGLLRWGERGDELRARLGLDQHPVVGPHRVPLTIELLSPANRPAQVTTDLPGFWRGSYAAVRADLRGRYPKHAWPEDPLHPGKGGPAKSG